MARCQKPQVAMGRPANGVHGVTPGSTEHKLLLAMRAPGGITTEQIATRFGHVSASLHRLRNKGLIVMPPNGNKGVSVQLTAIARAITEPNGPLSRSRNLITYCQL